MDLNNKELKELIQTHENVQLEFKESKNSLPNDFWSTYSAFANTSGGYIILGVKEENNQNILSDVANYEKIKTDLFTTACNSTKVNIDLLLPDNIHVKNIDGKYIIVIYIPEAAINQKPVYINNSISNTYLRKHDGDHRASQEELSALIRNHSDTLDSELLDGYTIDDLDPESIVKYQVLLRKRYTNQEIISMSPMDFLISIGAFQYDHQHERKLKLTLGGLLFFGKYNAILSRLPHYHVDFFDKRGTNERWSDRVSSGDLDFPDLNIFNYYSIVYEKLLSSIERPFNLKEDMVRKSYAELNIALQEAFVNMIIHADYLSNTTALIVEIHEPYYIFTNPGIMKIPVESFFLESRSVTRNSIIVNLFRRMGASDRAGTGSKKILNVAVKNQFKMPEIESSLEKTILKLWLAHPIDVTPGLSKIEKDIYNLFDNDMINLTAKKINELLPIYSYSQVNRSLKKLASKNLIIKLGANRNRSYTKCINKLEFIKNIDQVTKIIKSSIYTK